MSRNHETVSLAARLDMTYFSLVMGFVEESAGAFGMEKADTLKLRLACEEVFSYLMSSDQKGKVLTVEAENGVYYVEARFLFDARRFDPRAFEFNIEDHADPETSLAGMGLIIASRFADNLYLLHESGSKPGVAVVKEKSYPEPGNVTIVPVKTVSRFHVASPDAETLKLFVRQVTAFYPSRSYPPDFHFPGKVVDMVEGGTYRVLVASGVEAGTAGGIVWHIASARMVEVFGPYLFNQPPEYGMSAALMDHLLMAVAKSNATGMIAVYPTPELPGEYFESLGTMDYAGPDGQREQWSFYFRQLKEDPGLQVWAHADLTPFLTREYGRLFFAREVLTARDEGEARLPHSVFSLNFNHHRSLVRLRLLWDGADAATILLNHVKALVAEGFANILFHLDLGYPRHAYLTPTLQNLGFVPRLILPYAGKADIVVFQYTRDR